MTPPPPPQKKGEKKKKLDMYHFDPKIRRMQTKNIDT